MMKEDTKPRNIFCGWYPKTDNLKHEVLLSDFLFPFFNYSKMKRGNNCDSFIRPDAEMELCSKKFYVELDTGSVHHRTQKQRWQRYEKVTQEFLLVVTLSPKRMQNLMKHADAVSSIALFTTLEQAQNEPFGDIWSACNDKRHVALPRPKTVEKGC